MADVIEMPRRSRFVLEVAGNVRAEMARARLSQRDVARLLQMPQSAVSRRNSGTTPWGLEELEALAPHLGTSASALCAIRDSNPEPAD